MSRVAVISAGLAHKLEVIRQEPKLLEAQKVTPRFGQAEALGLGGVVAFQYIPWSPQKARAAKCLLLFRYGISHVGNIIYKL